MRKKAGTSPVEEIENISFENALGRLEQIVKELEKGELPLEESLARFSEGIKLSQSCLAKLNAADRQIDLILQEKNGKVIEYPLDLQEEKC